METGKGGQFYVNKNKAQYLDFLKTLEAKRQSEQRINSLELAISKLQERLNLLEEKTKGIGNI